MDQDAYLSEDIELRYTHIGRGVFAKRPFPRHAIIGEISGEVFDPLAHMSEYSMDVGRNTMNPLPPFRFLNHSCDPNCEFTWDGEEAEDEPLPIVYLVALRNVQRGEQLTIDYNWPAECAIRCQCNSERCRGWVAAEEELGKIESRLRADDVNSHHLPEPNVESQDR